jgi:hypothetical protein
MRHLLIKDWKLLWPMVGLTAAVQVGRTWAGASSDLLQESPAADALLHPLTLAWFIGIAALTVATVHQDPIPGVDQDWLIRPLRRTQLLLAKLVFLGITVSGPMLVVDLVSGLAAQMPFVSVLEAAVAKDLFVYVCLVVPVVALAATTRNMTEIILFGAALFLVFSVSLSLSAFFLGAEWCPTCGTGMVWLQHFVQHLLILLGAAVVLLLQYFRRRSALARAVALIGAASLVYLQLPWSSAYAIEAWLTEPNREAAPVALELDTGNPQASAASRSGQPPARGRVDRAIDYLHHRDHEDQTTIAIPVRIAGIADDQLVLVDRSQVRMIGADGRLLQEHIGVGKSAGLSMDTPEDAIADGPASQLVDVPVNVDAGSEALGVRLQIEYSMTLLNLRATHRIAAAGGDLRSRDVGVCATRVHRDTVTLSCRALGAAPTCYSASVYSADGRLGAETLRCDGDYRRYWPTLIDVLSPYGVEFRLRGSDALDPAELARAYLVLKVYGERAHFKRSLTAALPPSD